MTDLFARTPFITRDGIDKDGIRAEVKVFTGVGKVIEIEDKNRNSRITFQVDNTHNPSCYCEINSKAYELCVESLNEGTPLEYRIEKVRKTGVDRTLPFSTWEGTENMKAAHDSIVTQLAAVSNIDEGELNWVYGKISTRMEEDHNDNLVQNPLTTSLEDFTGANRQKTQSTPSNSSGTGYYRIFDHEGNPTPGSALIQAYASIVNYVSERGHKDKQEYANDPYMFASKLALLTNRLVDLFDDSPDRFYGQTGVRARSFVFAVLETKEITDEILGDKSELKKLLKSVYDESVKRWEWALEKAREFAD